MLGEKVGAYRLKRELGHGAFGKVYEADEEFDGRAFARVAVKIIQPRDAAHRASIIGELATLANFRHPNIVGYRAFGELPASPTSELAPVYIALELAEGGTLSSRYKKAEFSLRQMLELARDVAEGLAFIANRGWTHRDIKPDNLLLFEGSAESYWKISDLGLARPSKKGEQSLSGTRHYMAPEVWRGQVAPSNDVWALGLCLREAATRQRLWEDIAPGALPHLIETECERIDLTPLPPVLRTIVAGCLEADPAQRWDAAQVAAQARQTLADLPEIKPDVLVVALDGTGHFRSISEALEASSSGAHITIMPGLYTESLVLEHDVHLTGHQASANSPRVVIEFGGDDVVKIGENHASPIHATLENLTLRGTSRQLGHPCHTVSLSDARVQFKNCRISNDALAGVVVGANAQAKLMDCRIEEIATEGVLAQEGGHIVLEGGRIRRCGRSGIATRGGGRLEARHLVVNECGGNGVHLGQDTVAYLQGCQLVGNKRSGVRAESTTLARMENCVAIDNGYGAWEIPFGAEVTRIKTRPA